MLTSILILNLAISLALVTVIFSFLNTGYQNLKGNADQAQNRIVVDLRIPIPIKNLEKVESKWRDIDSLQWSYLLSNEEYVQSKGNSEVFQVFGVNKNMNLLKELPVDPLGEKEAVISRKVAEKMFPNLQDKEIIGQQVKIANMTFDIAGVEQASLVENVYIPIEKFKELYGDRKDVVMGNFIFGQTDSETIKTEVLPTLSPYKPSISTESPDKERLSQFYGLLIVSLMITLGLMIYVILNFIYIFTFKISKDKNKWEIFINLGATRTSMKRVIYIESGFILLIAMSISALVTFLIANYVDIEGFQLELNLSVFIILFCTISLVIVITVETTLRKIWNSFFKGAKI